MLQGLEDDDAAALADDAVPLPITGALRVTSEPEGAQVTLNGEARGATPALFGYDTDPGAVRAASERLGQRPDVTLTQADFLELAATEVARFHGDMEALNTRPIMAEPHATEWIDEMIEQKTELAENIIGAGESRMNRAVVCRTSHGLGTFLLGESSQAARERGAVEAGLEELRFDSLRLEAWSTVGSEEWTAPGSADVAGAVVVVVRDVLDVEQLLGVDDPFPGQGGQCTDLGDALASEAALAEFIEERGTDEPTEVARLMAHRREPRSPGPSFRSAPARRGAFARRAGASRCDRVDWVKSPYRKVA